MVPKKVMDLREFWQEGYLHELNRIFLHPLGLALEVVINEDTGTCVLGDIWDMRDDPGGIQFSGVHPEKAIHIQEERLRRVPARVKALGYFIQPGSDIDVELNEALITAVHTAVDQYDANKQEEEQTEATFWNYPPE